MILLVVWRQGSRAALYSNHPAFILLQPRRQLSLERDMDKDKLLDDSIWKPSAKARVHDRERLKSYRNQTAKGAFALLPLEKWWRDRSEFLESRGYRLRPRFRPGWKPSWMEDDLNPNFCEDARSHKVSLSHSTPSFDANVL